MIYLKDSESIFFRGTWIILNRSRFVHEKAKTNSFFLPYSNPNFDIEKVKAATRLFLGKKNFETFSGKNRTGRELRYERHLNELKIEDGEPLMSIDPLSKNFHYWNVVCSSRSFLYNQVKQKKTNSRFIDEMLLNRKLKLF